jgi:outer membrane protein, heavy metal efflux system
MRNNLPILLLLLFLSPAISAQEQEAGLDAVLEEVPTESSTNDVQLQQLLEAAYDNNSTIKVSRSRLESAQARTGHVGSLPNPQASATIFILPIETRVGPQRVAVGVSQAFPFFGKLSKKEDIAARRAEAANAQVNAQIRDVLTNVRLAYYELHYLVRAMEVVKQNQKIAQTIVDHGSAAFGRGDIPYYDLNRARAELARLAYDEATLQDLVESQWRTINALLEREDMPVGSVPQLPIFSLETPLPELEELANSNRPEIEAALHLRDGAEAGVELAQKGYWPDFKVGLTWLVVEDEGPAPDSGTDALGVTVGFEVPIWRDSIGARVDEAKANKRAASHMVQTERTRIRSLLADRVYDFVNARRLLQLYDTNLLPQANAAMDSAEEQSLKSGKLGTLLERRAIWLQFSLARERALADMYKSLARLEQVVGIPLEVKLRDGRAAPGYEKKAPLQRLAAESAPGDETVQERPKTKPEGPGHVAHGKQWDEASSLVRKLGLKKALKKGITRALVIRSVLNRNPGIKEADQALLATHNRFPQVAYLDNLIAQYADISTGLRPAQGGMAPAPMNRETYAGPGTLAIKSRIASIEVSIAAVRTGLIRRTAVTKARLALADYRYAASARTVIKELIELTSQLREVATKRVSAGSTDLTDVLQAEMLEEELTTRHTNLADLSQRASARMATLADLPADFEFGPANGDVSTPLPDLKDAQRRAAARHELRTKDLQIERLEQTISLIQARSYPELSTGQSELRQPLAKDGKMAFPNGPTVKEDIYTGGRQAYIDELLQRLAALQSERENLKRTIENEVVDAHSNLQIALRNKKLHGEELSIKSRQVLDLTFASYRQGRSNFVDLLVAEREYIHHQLSTLEALRDAEKAFAALQDAAVWK